MNTRASGHSDTDFRFKFSIIMSVYKVEEFIDEAVQSLVDQTLPFTEDVQLIMVDDGSPDNSGAICDKYKSLYPHNIVVIHKENGGLSSARNEGLKYVEGKYVNFFDPDDILTKNTLETVYSFFERNYDNTDIVSIPLFYFGDMTGKHHLNDKFKSESYVINLIKQYHYVQLSLASSFIKHDIAVNMFFDDKLVIAEDAEQILKILLNKPFLGAVSGCKYMYRRRNGSQVTSGSSKKGWYNDYVKLFSLKSFALAKEKFGYIPKFVQNAVMCDLQWRLVEQERPSVLSDSEFEEYLSLLNECLSQIDDDVIMRQKHLVLDTKIALLAERHGTNKYIQTTNDNVFFGYDSRIDHKVSNRSVNLTFLDINDTEIKITLKQVFFPIDKLEDIYLSIGENIIHPFSKIVSNHKKCIGKIVSKIAICNFVIPKSILTDKTNTVSFFTVINGVTVKNNDISAGRFFPVTTKYSEAYYYDKGFLFKIKNKNLYINRASRASAYAQELKFAKQLWKSNKKGERKSVIAKSLTFIYKFFHRKPIWIISDRLNKAGDNGEALFRYLHENKIKSVNYYYAITKCPDYQKLKPLGRVIDRNSLKYKIMHLAADYIISSHADEFVINPFDNYSHPYRNMLALKKFIFLQHGVTKDDISGWLNRFNKNINGFIVAAYPEERSMFDYDYYYSSENIWLTGFARFDRLYHDEKKRITIMPTWRHYLMTGYDNLTGIWNISEGFKESDYFIFYNSLINNEKLLNACEKNGYTLCFLPHPNIIPHISLFNHDDRVKFYSINDEYRDVYAQSDLVLTDYSSAVFDFAYLRKPLLYTHFDSERFFAGSHVYVKGYFDYERDGFGEITTTLDETVDRIIKYMENGCKLKDKYRERIDNFFAYNDKNNCQRIFNRIVNQQH